MDFGDPYPSVSPETTGIVFRIIELGYSQFFMEFWDFAWGSDFLVTGDGDEYFFFLGMVFNMGMVLNITWVYKDFQTMGARV